MPSIASRGAFGSGGRSLGPPTPVRNPYSPNHGGGATMALHGSDPVGGGRFNRPSSGAPAPAPAQAPAPASSWSTTAPAPANAPASSDWRDAFKKSDRPEKAPASSEGSSKFRAAVEAERWRSKLSGAEPAKKKDEDKLGTYEQPTQASWVAERLFGDRPPSADDLEEEEAELRAKRVVGQAWSVAAPVDVGMIDRLEETLRKRLGEMERMAAHAGKAARQMFAECDPSRSGRIVLGPFIESVGRKLNYEFGSRGGQPSSRQVLAAVFARYDLARAGVLAAEDFHCALVGATLPGRASGRVANSIGRLREGLEREAGGYDALRAEDARWYAAQKEGGFPPGCLPAGAFIDGLLRLVSLSGVSFSEADLNVLVEAFEPPPASGDANPLDAEPLFSFDEFTLAVRGPPMGAGRVGLVRAAYAALKEDANKKSVKPEHLAARYDVSRHPAVEAGGLSDEEAAMAFLAPWKDQALDEEVTLREFGDRYEWISPLYESDADFEEMMKAAWRLK